MAEQAAGMPLWLGRARTALSSLNIHSYIKRGFDLLVAVVGLFFTAWLIVLAWICLSLVLRRDALVLERLTGRNGQPFLLASLQLADTDGEGEPAPDAQLYPVARVVGRLRLHKLIALVNLLKGEISLVGPEPELLAYAATLEGEDRRVLTLRPGVTGAGAQRGHDLEEKLALERDYLEQATLFRDLHHLWWWILF
jgi:lipopolysaccharide/colanic/teichoic acid biosynthesis glycosyltransferase